MWVGCTKNYGSSSHLLTRTYTKCAHPQRRRRRRRLRASSLSSYCLQLHERTNALSTWNSDASAAGSMARSAEHSRTRRAAADARISRPTTQCHRRTTGADRPDPCTSADRPSRPASTRQQQITAIELMKCSTRFFRIPSSDFNQKWNMCIEACWILKGLYALVTKNYTF